MTEAEENMDSKGTEDVIDIYLHNMEGENTDSGMDELCSKECHCTCKKVEVDGGD